MLKGAEFLYTRAANAAVLARTRPNTTVPTSAASAGFGDLRKWRCRKAAPGGMNQPEDELQQPQIITSVNSKDDPLQVLAAKTGPGKSRCFVTNKCKSFWKRRNKKLVNFEFNDLTATRPRLVWCC